MVKVNASHTLLDAVTSSGYGTSLSYKNTERSSVQVVYTSTGGTVEILVEASNATTSTGTYTELDSTTTTGATSGNYTVEIDGAYRFVRAGTSSHGSTGTSVTATIVTQGEGY